MTIDPIDTREATLLNIAHMYGTTVHLADLPGTQRGRYEAQERRIVLRRTLTTAQRVSALAHEVVHARRGDDGPQTASVEAHVEEEAATLIITEHDYARAETMVGRDPWMLAAELDLTPGLVAAWQSRRARERTT